jgi:hypothetical protein
LSLYAEHGGDLTLGQNKDLQDQMISFIRSPAEPALTHHDEAREQDRFNGNDAIQQREGARIEVMSCMQCVQRYPSPNPADMKQDEPQAADGSSYRISDTFRTCAASQEILLVARNELDLLTEMQQFRHTIGEARTSSW